MTPAPADGGSGAPGPAAPTPHHSATTPGDRPALSRLVDDVDEFGERTWGREPALRPATEPTAFADLLTERAVDELVSERGLRTPFLRVAKDGSTLPGSAFTAPGGVGAGIADQVSDDRLTALFAGGSTLVLQGLHRISPPVIDFCQQLAADLGHPVQANAYVTPPQNRGFDPHYDVHDVFVLQIAGTKRWTIHAPVHPAPLRDQPWTHRRAAVSAAAEREPVLERVLEPGDVLYLPRGYLHSATALGGVSVHLTLGVHTWTRYAVAEELAALALERLAIDEEARTSLPLGTDLLPDGLDADLMTKRLREALESVDPADVAARLGARRRDAQRAAPIGPLAQHALAASLADDTVLRLRDHLEARLDRAGGARIVSRAGTVPVADVPEPVLHRLLAGERVTAADLGLDPARTLIEAGLVVAG